MAILDKSGVLNRVCPENPIVIELGCGPSKLDPGAIGVDVLDFPCVDLVGDIFEALAALPDASVRSCRSSHFLEHVADLGRLIDEIERVLVPGGEMIATVPHFSNPYFYSDPTHSRFFGLYSMSYFATDDLLRRKVPLYGREPALALEAVHLGFNSPFPVRGLIKRAIGRALNLCTFVQEFWEENLCYLIPCYELTYRLRRIPRG
ncbi:methyltransferase domain-containing protein [Niveibacterium terrae]|uniref:methyltransferase domain-containing protein n=1 Tax=Niveibacterium terrae TaxID=3373598 RepID=UPI003A8E1092